MENLRISTMTAVSAINSDINLDNLYKNAVINDILTFIQHGSFGTKGESNKKKRKQRIPKKQKSFFNQVTLHVNCDKIVNVKLFNNGKIQMTGLKYENHGEKVLDLLLPCILKLDAESGDKILNNTEIEYKPFNIAMINSDFFIGYKVKREVVHREIVDAGMYSSYEPCIYPGVNIKYYYNKDTEGSSNAGICKCNDNCNGKGCGHGDGLCKKITIVVFMSGQIMITGARNRDHILICYNFITKMLNSKKELLILQ
jgi:TATA-box binding protein (TBP) (component of TFIID and TFIIIB)